MIAWLRSPLSTYTARPTSWVRPRTSKSWGFAKDALDEFVNSSTWGEHGGPKLELDPLSLAMGVSIGVVAGRQQVFDVPPWVAGPYRKPRFARVRWALRRWWKIKAMPPFDS